jgi:hypothetical protein
VLSELIVNWFHGPPFLIGSAGLEIAHIRIFRNYKQTVLLYPFFLLAPQMVQTACRIFCSAPFTGYAIIAIHKYNKKF